MQKNPLIQINPFHLIDNFKVISCLGKGTFAEVYLVMEKDSDNLFAMKIVKIENKNK